MASADVKGLEAKRLDRRDESRSVADKGRIAIVTLGSISVGRATLEPGWRWSEHVKPLAGTASCQVTHVGYVVSGRMHIKMDEGAARLDRNLPPGADRKHLAAAEGRAGIADSKRRRIGAALLASDAEEVGSGEAEE